jgi:predicted ATPase
MRYLFVDNFRGFTNTLIPIKDVNFFVGENSTGKTSILGLLNLLTQPRFWLNQEFDIYDVGFVHFSDMVSAYSSNKTFFSVGLVDFNSKEGDIKTHVDSFLMTFTNYEGIPKLQSYTYNSGLNELKIKFTRKTVKYKYNKLKDFNDHDDFIKNVFAEWIDAHHTDKRGYKLLSIDMPFEILNPLTVTSILNDLLNHSKPKRHRRLSFKFPYLKETIAWIAPIRTKPKRTYDAYKVDFSPEGGHTPYVIRKVLDSKTESSEFIKFISRIGRESGLFEKVIVKRHGKLQTAPFELDVVLNKKELNLCCVGYGVSQSLPVIVESFLRPEGSWFSIQQPEIHLHPKAQAALGDLFFELALMENKKFLIETHSDYMIDRFRINYRKKESNTLPKSQILYFERDKNGNKVYQLEIDEQGEIPSEQPIGYRDFFVKEEMDILDL